MINARCWKCGEVKECNTYGFKPKYNLCGVCAESIRMQPLFITIKAKHIEKTADGEYEIELPGLMTEEEAEALEGHPQHCQIYDIIESEALCRSRISLV